MSVRIRDYEPRDREPVLAIAHRLSSGVAPWRDAAKVAAAVRGWVESSLDGIGADNAAFVAELAGEVVGFVSVSRQTHWSGEVDAYIGELMVREDCEGRGVGRALVRAAEDWGRAQGLCRIRLATGSANAGALGLYERLGYAREDITLSRPLVAGEPRRAP